MDEEMFDYKIVPGSERTQHTAITWKVKSLTAEIIFGVSVENTDQLEYLIYYCPNGVSGGNYSPLILKNGKKLQLIKEKEQPTKALLNFALPTDLADRKEAEIVVMCRLNFNGSQFFPLEEKGQPRYIAAKVKILLNSRFGNTVFKEDYKTLVVNTKSKILGGHK